MKFLSIVLFFSLFSIHLQAQLSSIKGYVTNKHDSLENINVKILGLKYSVKTNSSGGFEINNLPIGTYEILFTGIGYQNKKLKFSIHTTNVQCNVELQSADANLNDVVITGVSRATELRKSSVPIAILSRKSMDKNANTNLIDAITKGVPGVTAVTTGPNVSKPFIRGLGYNRVLTLYDGLRQEGQQWGDEHGIEVDEYGISRVEVVKGPASLTYGSDALAGVINMIPFKPSNQNKHLKGDFTLNYQSNNGLISSSFGLAYLRNDWKYTFRATNKLAHNYYNKIDGLVYGTAFSEYNLSASAQVDKQWGWSKLAITYYDNRMEIPDGSRDSLSRKFTGQIKDFADDIKNRPIVPDDRLDSYSINPLHQHIQHTRLYNKSFFKVARGDLNVLVGAQQSVRREYNHPTLAEQAGLYVVLNTLNYDLKYNFSDFSGIESTLGINGMYQANRSKDATDFPIPDYDLFDIGAFFFAKKTIEKLDISFGLRLDRRNINWDNFYVGTNQLTGFGKQTGVNDGTATLQFPSFSKNYYGLSGSFGLVYNLSEKFLIKANLARGYRAPNITEIGSNGLDPGAHIVYLGNRTFKPEFNLQEDIGFSAYLTELDISVELFNNSIQNYIYQSRLTDGNGNPVVIVPGNLTYQYQQAKAQLYGSEISVNLHPSNVKWFSLNSSAAYVVGLNKNETLLENYGNDARYLPFIPPLQLRTELKITAQGTSFLEKPYVKMDAAFFANQNKFYALDNTETFTDGYSLFAVGLGSTVKSRKGSAIFDFFIQCDNVFNTAYQSNLNRLKYFEYYQSSPNGKYGIYNMGRNFSFKIIVPF